MNLGNNRNDDTPIDWMTAPKTGTRMVSTCFRRDETISVSTKTAVYGLTGLEAEAGTTGAKGGNVSHGARTYLRLEVCGDKAEGGAETHVEFNVFHDKLEIILGGDWEIDAIKSALRHMLRTLEEQTIPKEVAALPLDEGGLLQEIRTAIEMVNKGRSKPIYEQTNEVHRALLPQVANCELCRKPTAHVRAMTISPEISQVCGATKGYVYFRLVGLCDSCEKKDYKSLVEQKKFEQDGAVASASVQ